jgi:serine/threonine-protein kinase
MSDEINPASANVGPGDKIAGYRLEEQVGQGGMAVVYRARDERLDRQVALKVLAPALTADPAFRARFIRESRAAAAVDHRHILPVYDSGAADDVMFIAMRYIAGGDVRTLFAGGQIMPIARVWHIVTQVADALDSAHGLNLIHRDVKPANILIDVPARSTSGRLDHVYLTDFGISMQGVTSHLTSTGQFVGSLAYISPEQIEARVVQGAADQYSLACTTYEMLTGAPPFAGDVAIALINAQLSLPPPPISARRPELPSAVELVLAKALAKSPEQRYPTCSEFADDLGKALGLAAGTASVVSDPQATTSSADIAQPSVPTPTEITNPALMPAALMPEATTGPGQYQPAVGQHQPAVGHYQPPVGHGPVLPVPMPPPPWIAPVPVPAPPKRKDQAPLIAALVAIVVVVLAAAGSVAFIATRNSTPSTSALAPPSTSASSPATTPPTSTAPAQIPTVTPATETEAAEVMAVNGLLTNSGVSRTELSAVVTDVGNCLNVGDDVTELNQIVAARQGELSSAESLQVDAIPGGSQLQSDLVAALQASIAADNDYLSWAQQQNEDNCAEGANSQYYSQALSDDQTATDDKATFEQDWTPLADQYGYDPNPYF